MFTGIISTTSKIKKITTTNKHGREIVVLKPKLWRLKKGDSISVNGVCLTATRIQPNISFTLMPETIRCTNFSRAAAGDVVNLERPLKAGDRFDGHVVLGHVDTTGSIQRIKKKGNAYILTIVPKDKKILRFVAAKGSVAVHGISLTVVKVSKTNFVVHIIPYTWQHTNLGLCKKGSDLNIEVDVAARYKIRQKEWSKK